MDYKNVYLLLGFGVLQCVIDFVHAKSCTDARHSCTHTSRGCSLALTNYFLFCETMPNSDENGTCSRMCLEALTPIMLIPEGDDFVNCDCENDEDCWERKRSVKKCADSVSETIAAINSNKTIRCSQARMLCESETSCLTALRYSENSCEDLGSVKGCTNECNHSLVVLYQQEKAKKLKTCLCADETDDGTSFSTCEFIKYRTKTCMGEVEVDLQSPSTTTTKKPNGEIGLQWTSSATRLFNSKFVFGLVNFLFIVFY